MKIIFEITNDTTKNEYQQIHKILEQLENKNTNIGQKTLNPKPTADDKKVICSRCGKDLYNLYDNDTVKKIITYCTAVKKERFNSRIFCKDCQEYVGGDEP